MYVIKVGSLYLTADGEWSRNQADALRVGTYIDDGAFTPVDTPLKARAVKLRTRQ